jgi:hypothetical protein
MVEDHTFVSVCTENETTILVKVHAAPVSLSARLAFRMIKPLKEDFKKIMR